MNRYFAAFRLLILIVALSSSESHCLPFFAQTSKNQKATIDLLTSSDIPAARDLFVRSFASAYRQLPGLSEQADWEKRLGGAFDETAGEWSANKNKITALKITVEGKLAGVIFALSTSEHGEVYIMQLAVSEKSKGEGLGKLLMGGLSQHLRDQGAHFSKMTLVARKQNVPAIEFYKSLGFDVSEYEYPGYSKDAYVGMELLASGCEVLISRLAPRLSR